jgi:hypothetical protein
MAQLEREGREHEEKEREARDKARKAMVLGLVMVGVCLLATATSGVLAGMGHSGVAWCATFVAWATAAFAGKLFADVDTQNDNRSYHAFCAGLRSGMREASREK